MRKDWRGTLAFGERIGEGAASGRWEVIASLGEGGYAEVYEVRDTLSPEATRYALKVDTPKVKKDPRLATVRNEAEKLKRLQSCDGVPRLVEGGIGKHHGRSYVVMELFAEDNLAVFQQKALLDAAAIRSIGLQTLKLLQSLHSSGWLHRDVKPANFVRTKDSDPATGGEWRIVDFGLAKPYISKEGEIVDARDGYNEFRGSTNYASIKAHQKEELGRRDDLWSWFYMLVELLQGKLLWRENRAPGKRASGSDDEAKKTAHRMKLRALSDPNALFASGRCPEALMKMSRHLANLQFKESPDYTKLQAWLAELKPADVTRTLQPVPGNRGAIAAMPGGVSQPAVATHPHQAAARQWHHSNNAHHHAAASHMNGHGGWGAPQNGGMHGGGPRFVWHEGQALQIPPPGGWDASNHPLSQQELMDGAFDMPSPAAPNMLNERYSQASHMSSEMDQPPLPPHLSVPENWDQQLGQLGSEFGDEFDQPQVQRKRSAERQLYADIGADLDEPEPKRARQTATTLAAAPPDLLEDNHGLHLQPPLPDSSAPVPFRPPFSNGAAAVALPLPGASPGKPAEPRLIIGSSARAAAHTTLGMPAGAGGASARAAPAASPLGKAAEGPRLRGQLGSDSKALPRSASASGDQAKDPGKQARLANGAPVQQGPADAKGMASYGPAFLQKAIGMFEGGRVSVNAKILKNLIPAMDPAEAYVGLGWAGWCIAQNTTPETQLQASQMLDHLGDFFKGLSARVPEITYS